MQKYQFQTDVNNIICFEVGSYSLLISSFLLSYFGFRILKENRSVFDLSQLVQCKVVNRVKKKHFCVNQCFTHIEEIKLQWICFQSNITPLFSF